jgi:hypothetical protein
VFGRPSIEFLGHNISAAGSSPLPSRVGAIAEFPRPATVRQLQAFLGLFNFYRKFIPAASKLILPLTRALHGGPRGDQPLPWSAEMIAAFSAARLVLLSSAVLEHPVDGAELSLATDASSSYVGAAIQQKRPGQGWRPLGFFSAQLDKAQVNYSAFDRELFAVVAAIKHFRFMLEGQLFIVFTEHRPLIGDLNRRSDPWSGRQQRHLSFIAEFSPTIRHIAGHSNVVADTLSRPASSSPVAPTSHQSGAGLPPFPGSFGVAARPGSCPVAPFPGQPDASPSSSGGFRVAAKDRTEVKEPSGSSVHTFAASTSQAAAISASSPVSTPPVNLAALAAAQRSCHNCQRAATSSVLRVTTIQPFFTDPSSKPSTAWLIPVFGLPEGSSPAVSSGRASPPRWRHGAGNAYPARGPRSLGSLHRHHRPSPTLYNGLAISTSTWLALFPSLPKVSHTS